jgi:hypothetical protein
MKRFKNTLTTKAIVITSLDGVKFIKSILGKMLFDSLQRTIQYNDVMFLTDSVMIVNSYALAEEIAFNIQHEGLEEGGYASILKVSQTETFESLTAEEIRYSLFGQK